MREIKFRGLELFTGDWVYGSHLKTGTGSEYIVPQTLIAHQLPQYTVDKDTVGQFTGLKDMNGKEIYEGDIVKVPVDINQETHGNYSLHEVLIKNGVIITSYLKSEKGQILPRGYTAGFLLDSYEFDNKTFLFSDDPTMDTKIEVIGNIFKNLELLEDEE